MHNAGRGWRRPPRPERRMDVIGTSCRRAGAIGGSGPIARPRGIVFDREMKTSRRLLPPGGGTELFGKAFFLSMVHLTIPARYNLREKMASFRECAGHASTPTALDTPCCRDAEAHCRSAWRQAVSARLR